MQTPDVVVPLVPTAIELAVEVLPMVLLEMVKFPAVPAVLIPKKVNPIVAAPLTLMPPILLFWIPTVPVEAA